MKCPWPLGERVYLSLADGSTLTYDLYQPLNEHEGMYKNKHLQRGIERGGDVPQKLKIVAMNIVFTFCLLCGFYAKMPCP